MNLWMRRKLRQAIGKVRRFWMVHFRKDYVTWQTLLRQGECNQCGNCCEVLFRCPFLIRGDGITMCSIYENRPGQCAAFPIDEKCLAEVDFDCSYSFGRVAPVAVQGLALLLQIESARSSREAVNF